MALATDNFDDIRIEDGLTIAGLNNAIDRLVKNDSLLTINVTTPGIWECKWFNVAEPSRREELGYKKGDAVWINTEDIDDFVQNHETQIIDCAKNFPNTRYFLHKYRDNNDKLKEIYYSFVNGQNDFDEQHKYLYYIGELTDNVQIRISTKDNNTSLPTDDSCWKDFIRRDLDQEYFRTLLFELYNKCVSNVEQEHLNKYHMQGLVGKGLKYETNQSYAKRFLDTNIKNVSKVQKINSHKYTNSTEGFDYVVKTLILKGEGDTTKWMKLWKSGYLEHGGIVDMDNMFAEDSMRYGDGVMTISLEWSNGADKSTYYNYQPMAVGSFYQNDDSIYVNQSKYPYVKTSQQLGYSDVYQIQVTPIFDDTTDIKCPYQTKKSGIIDVYEFNETLNVDNVSFSFKICGARKYSYKTSGFIVPTE